MAPRSALLAAALALASPVARADRIDELAADVGRLRAELVALGGMLREREARLEAMTRELKSMGEDVQTLRALPASFPVSGPFLSGPPLASDSVGVAKVAVFAPRLEVDSSRRHDLVFLKVRRVEAETVRAVAELELGQEQTSVELPIDRNGGLYVVEWSTSEGFNYSLLLKDGASAQTTAQVQVKQLQAQGRFLFVGYRVE